MQFLQSLYNSFISNESRNAFCINDIFYSYKELLVAIDDLRHLIRKNTDSKQHYIGLVLNDDLYTYATIFALWFEGRAYVPINPNLPLKRNIEILNSTEIDIVFDSIENNFKVGDFKIFNFKPKNHEKVSFKKKLDITNIYPDSNAYILFTSGSTGRPKGIPISFKNLDTLIDGLSDDKEFKLTPDDKCLQMYDLTFDASLTALLPGLLAGSCLYTVPSNSIKYFHILKLLNKYDLTVLKMVPSIVHYLRPYFDQINAKQVRYCIFGGGKLFEDILIEWQKCIPNSIIVNHYGPTESTVCSHRYYINSDKIKTFNGIVGIGKPWKKLDCLIIDESNNVQANNVKGELCVAGDQLTSGYWKNKELNLKSFFDFTDNLSNVRRFYKTGDICFRDDEGDYLYIGRKDFQVKIRGYRVELSEIEYHAKALSGILDIVAIDLENKLGNAEIGLAIISEELETTVLLSKMKLKIPSYMIPTKFKFLDEFPLNANGKIDRNKLRTLF